jgi:signal transduction histidine kinase
MSEMNHMSIGDIGGHVLVVDDEAFNRELLNAILENKGYTVVDAENGRQALEIVESAPVDVILLDVMMPFLDGFEVCRRIKANPVTARIPVILVTSLSDRRDRLRGIEEGASDFLTKPVDIQEVLLRVRNAVYTKKLYDRLEFSYEKLKELEKLRDKLTHMLVHDMRSPLAGILGYLEMIKMQSQFGTQQRILHFTNQALHSTTTLIEMVSSILDVSRLEEGKMPLHHTLANLEEMAGQVIESLACAGKDIQISLTCPQGSASVLCDEEIIRRVFVNLIANAIKFTDEEGRVNIQIEKNEEALKVMVSDNGPGIPPEHLQMIFEKYSQVELRSQIHKYSTGLGLTFCKLALEAHGGHIGVDSQVGKGSTFWFVLPCNDTAHIQQAPTPD